MSKNIIKEILNKVKNDYSDIVWIESNRVFHRRSEDRESYLIENMSPKLKESYNQEKFYLINRIKDIEDYIVITKITKEPDSGNIEFTKNNKKEEFKESIEQKKLHFQIKQDFFICDFFRVIGENGTEYLEELERFLDGISNEIKQEVINTKEEENDQLILPSVNTILYGPPGTGKTYNSIKYAVNTIDRNFNRGSAKTYTDYVNKFNELKAVGQIAFTTFHQSYGYEEFIEGIKPVLGDISEKNELSYKISDGMFKEFCKKATSNKDKKYVFIIDEINRGNISKIFGELITLIEDSKRAGEDEAMSVTLPYSQELFSVPKNVYILGTMNTADRSIALMDTALRRRFEFIEMMPKEELLTDIVIDNVNVKEMLETMNRRIEALYDREHILGHAFFMPLKNEKKATINQLASIFTNKIIPLLQEYFYEDYEKIMLVLGIDTPNKDTKKFISVKSNRNLFKNIQNIDLIPTYQINEKAFQIPDNYMTIYNGASN